MSDRLPNAERPEETTPESGQSVALGRTTLQLDGMQRTQAAALQGAATREALLGEVERIARLGGFVWTAGDPHPIWSDEFFRILGYQPGAVTPGIEAFLLAVHPEDVERVRAHWDAAQRGQIEDTEYRIIHHASDEIRYVRGSGRVYRDGARITHIIGALQDITESKRSAVALEETLAIARAAERVAGLGSFVVRVEAMEMVWTEGLKVLTGLDEPNADAATHLERLHPDDREKQMRWWDRLVRERSVEPLTVRVMRPDGSMRHLFTQAAVMRLADGVERVVGTTMDVTERVQMEEQLRHAAKMEAIGTLSAGVAHDFNNYLMVMESSLSMLGDSTDLAERDELVDAGRLALSRCMELTRQLLAFARRQPFRPESIDLNEVVIRFQDLLNRAVGRRASLRMERSGLPLHSRVDPRHVERMLTNLVVNAADAIEDVGIRSGRITVRVEAVSLSAPRRAIPSDVPPGSYVCVVVEDNGGGIDPARLPRIFDPYFTTKPQGRGTGLGLASVYGMARQNDGHVTVGGLDTGTCFTLWFPRIDTEGLPTSEPEGLNEVGPEEPLGQILIVEDVEQVRNIAARILSSAGFNTLTAPHGKRALELLDAGQKVRLVLTDLQMPVMGGRELAQRLRERKNAPPVIFMTGYSEDTHGHTWEDTGGDPGLMLLAKPFTPDRLIEFVKSALG